MRHLYQAIYSVYVVQPYSCRNDLSQRGGNSALFKYGRVHGVAHSQCPQNLDLW